mgnify:CR=1 FL=1
MGSLYVCHCGINSYARVSFRRSKCVTGNTHVPRNCWLNRRAHLCQPEQVVASIHPGRGVSRRREPSSASGAVFFFVLPEVQFVLWGFERGLVLYEISIFFENFQIFQKKTENIRNEKNGIG